MAQELGVGNDDEDDLYEAMDWLLERQERIEQRLAQRHLHEGEPVFADVSSSYYEGRTCPLMRFGYNRDGKCAQDAGGVRGAQRPQYYLAVCFAEASWAERRLALRDPIGQTIQATIDGYREEDCLWRSVEGSKVCRYVNWMGTLDRRYAPPADLRLRVQCEAVVERPGKAQRDRPTRVAPGRGVGACFPYPFGG